MSKMYNSVWLEDQEVHLHRFLWRECPAFFANCFGEILKPGPVTDWWWIPSQYTVVNLVTRGCSPELTGCGSLVQQTRRFGMEQWRQLSMC